VERVLVLFGKNLVLVSARRHWIDDNKSLWEMVAAVVMVVVGVVW